MQTADCITHEGVVEEIKYQSLIVSIVKKSACSMCHAKGACTSLDQSDQRIEINNFDPDLKPGDRVVLKMQKSMGPMAVFLAYGLPFIMFFIGLIVIFQVTQSEAFSGLGSLLIIAIYYLVLKLFHKRVQSTFHFEVEKYY
ncbi:MAG TPA: SoxR reducing system RseC family protein [Bacteroidales bacterium]|nr:SoxR reducing system RseC family protein [Bacteroidales bacterium]